MKKIFFTLMIVLSIHSVFAQTFEMKWSEQQKAPEGDDYIEKILYADKDAFFYDYTKRGLKNGVTKIDFHTVNKMSTDFKPLMSDKILKTKKLKAIGKQEMTWL